MEERWHVTVNELVTMFREALIALIPSMERCHIAWRNDEAYDDADEITATLFRSYVLNPIRWGLPDPPQTINVRPSDFTSGSSQGTDWIEVRAPDAPWNALALIGFSTRKTPYDTVKAQPLNEQGLEQGDQLLFAFQDVQFRFRRSSETQGWVPVETLEVLE